MEQDLDCPKVCSDGFGRGAQGFGLSSGNDPLEETPGPLIVAEVVRKPDNSIDQEHEQEDGVQNCQRTLPPS